jgi:acetyl esterase
MTATPPKPSPTEPGILAFHARCEAFYPADAVTAPFSRQRQWYDALCAAHLSRRPVR